MTPKNPPPLPTASPKPRSPFITVLAWFLMIVGSLGLPISVISAAMILVKSYGTQTSDPIGFIIVVLGPTMLLITGFGLLKRLGWARGAVLMLLALIIVSNGRDLLRGPRPTTTYTSSSGVETTVLGSGPNFNSLPVIGVCAALLVKLLSRSVREEFPVGSSATRRLPGNRPRSWRVGHRGRDLMYYEEKIGGEWQCLNISGEMLTGRAHHVIYFYSGEQWQSYPEWARHRRTEIIARIKSEFRPPDYEYEGDA